MFYVYANPCSLVHKFTAKTLEEAKERAEKELMFYTIRDGLMAWNAAIVAEKQFEQAFKTIR